MAEGFAQVLNVMHKMLALHPKGIDFMKGFHSCSTDGKGWMCMKGID